MSATPENPAPESTTTPEAPESTVSPRASETMPTMPAPAERHEADEPEPTLTRPSPVMNEDVVKVCREVLAPIVHADGGEMHLVTANAEDVHIHLSGTCAGCPGSALTRDRILAPVVSATMPKARLTVTTGVRVPEGAVRVEPPTGG